MKDTRRDIVLFTNDEVTNLLQVLKAWREGFLELKDELSLCSEEEKSINLKTNMKEQFINFHKICEEFICIKLEHLNMLDKKEYSHLGAMKEIKDRNEISNNFFNFYSKSIILKALLVDEKSCIIPTNEELFSNLNSNLGTIDELDIVIREICN